MNYSISAGLANRPAARTMMYQWFGTLNYPQTEAVHFLNVYQNVLPNVPAGTRSNAPIPLTIRRWS